MNAQNRKMKIINSKIVFLCVEGLCVSEKCHNPLAE